MQLNKRFWLILLMVLALTLTACDSDSDATEAVVDATEEATAEMTAEATAEMTAEATAEMTAEATAEMTAEATAEMTAEATVALSETITTLDGITLSYPEGWIVSEETGGLTLANDESVMTASTFEAGQIGATVVLLPDTTTGHDGVETVLQSFIDSTLGEDSEAQMTFSEIETFDSNGNFAAMVIGTGSDSEVSNALANVIVDVGDDLVLFSYITATGEMEQFIETIRAIAMSVSYDATGAEAEG